MNKKFALGKGLSALIPDEVSSDITQDSLLIPINKIKNNSSQPRKAFDNDSLVELAESIKNHGIVQP